MADNWEGGVVVYAGATDYAMAGRVIAAKKKTDADVQVEAERAAVYPDLVTPMRLKALENIKIRFVASGPAATHAVLGGAGGTLYALGRNDRGQLGLGDLCTRNVPTAITLEGAGDGVPVAAACGKAHTLVVLSSGAALAAGANGAGQLGTGSLPKAKAGTPEECVKTFVRSRVDGVATAAAGIDFSAWLGADGSVWTAGSPQYGQLGHGTDGSYNAKESSIKIVYEPQPTPTKVAGLAGVSVRALACGHSHVLALDDAGGAWTWGNGGYGRLGHGVQQDEHAPRKVEALSGRMPVDPHSIAACGSTSSWASMVGGTLCGWGKLKVSGDNETYPKPYMDLAGWEVKSMACGPATFAVAAASQPDGAPLTATWGAATHGELGFGPTGRKSAAKPDRVESLADATTRQVAMGTAFTIFLAEPGPVVDALGVWETTAPAAEPAAAAPAAAAPPAAGGKRKAAPAGGGRGKSKK